MTYPAFKRGQRVISRKDIIHAREPEAITVVRRDAGFMDGHWYIIRFADGGKLCSHASNLIAA